MAHILHVACFVFFFPRFSPPPPPPSPQKKHKAKQHTQTHKQTIKPAIKQTNRKARLASFFFCPVSMSRGHRVLQGERVVPVAGPQQDLRELHPLCHHGQCRASSWTEWGGPVRLRFEKGFWPKGSQLGWENADQFCGYLQNGFVV